MSGQHGILLHGHKERKRKLTPAAKRFRVGLGLFLLVSFASWSTSWMTTERRVRQAQLDVSRITHAARLFRADFNRCPSDLLELEHPPGGVPYLPPMVDPWGRPYQLSCPSYRDSEDVDVRSVGPDGVMGRDDIENLIVEATY